MMSDESPTTDNQKHEFCRKRGYPSAVFLPEWLYRAAESEGYDMRFYVILRPIPLLERNQK